MKRHTGLCILTEKVPLLDNYPLYVKRHVGQVSILRSEETHWTIVHSKLGDILGKKIHSTWRDILDNCLFSCSERTHWTNVDSKWRDILDNLYNLNERAYWAIAHSKWRDILNICNFSACEIIKYSESESESEQNTLYCKLRRMETSWLSSPSLPVARIWPQRLKAPLVGASHVCIQRVTYVSSESRMYLQRVTYVSS